MRNFVFLAIFAILVVAAIAEEKKEEVAKDGKQDLEQSASLGWGWGWPVHGWGWGGHSYVHRVNHYGWGGWGHHGQGHHHGHHGHQHGWGWPVHGWGWH